MICPSKRVVFHSYVRLPEAKESQKLRKPEVNCSLLFFNDFMVFSRWPHPIIDPYCDTSSTAQGGGGSFKNRKPIGEIGCCEPGMAERIHWWTERCLRSPLFLSLSLTIYLPTYLSSMYLSIDRSISLSFIQLPIYLPTYLSISLSLSSICLAVYLSICLSICLSVYLSICGAVSFSVM